MRTKEPVIEAQLLTGYESSSGFRDAFSSIMGKAPMKIKDICILKASWLDTPLGLMIAIADDNNLYLLEFVDRRGLEREIQQLRRKMRAAIMPGTAPPIISIEKELSLYFKGQLQAFTTPIRYVGSPFQIAVWEELKNIWFGKTCSYSELAKAIARPTARRAVASANGCNQLAIVIPCHRVIQADGTLGGYAGGAARKQWLLDLERSQIVKV